MKKSVFGRQFKRDANERKALFKNLLTSLVLQERIKTTPAKAKAIKGAADKLVTKAKKGGDIAFRNLAPDVHHKAVVKLINDIAPRFVSRQGGYTRIIKLPKNRVADNAPQVLMEWVERPAPVVAEPKAKKEAKSVKAQKSKSAKTEKKAEVKVSKETKETKAKKAASNAVEKEGKKAASNAAKTNKKEGKEKKK